MTSITLITPGGGRPQSFVLCEKYMARQTLWSKDIQWIVADDNEKDPVKCTLGQEHIFGAMAWRPGINTLRYNLAAALPLVKGDYVFIIENDDAYISPRYLETLVDMMKTADLVGECGVTYYNIAVRGFREMGNYTHASTCQTAFRKSYLNYFERAVHSGEQYLDIFLWGKARQGHHKFMLVSGANMCVGTKGLPGRGGIGFGHHNAHEFTPDRDFVKLKQLVGIADAEPYIAMAKGMK